MASFDSNTWYSIIFAEFGNSSLGVKASAPTEDYLYPINSSSILQQWQIIPAPSSTPLNPLYLFRVHDLGADYYLYTYCENESDCGYNTWVSLSATTTLADTTPNQIWMLADAGHGSYHVMNQANGTSFFLDTWNSHSESIWMNPNRDSTGLRWTFSSISAINDLSFSTTSAATLSASVPATSSATLFSPLITSSSGKFSQAASLTLFAPTSTATRSPTSSSVLSSRAKAGIGGGIAGLVVLLFLIVLAFVVFTRRKRRRTDLLNASGEPVSAVEDFDTRRAGEMASEPNSWLYGKVDTGQRFDRRAEMQGEKQMTLSAAELSVGESPNLIGRAELQSKHDRWPAEMPANDA